MLKKSKKDKPYADFHTKELKVEARIQKTTEIA